MGYAPSNFADTVFTDERIKVGLKKGKFGHPALIKAGANEEDGSSVRGRSLSVELGWLPNWI